MTASPSDCPVCASVAQGGRIRLTEEQAMLLEALLATSRRQVLRGRRKAIDGSDVSARREADKSLRLIDLMLEEIGATQVEKGWHNRHGEL